MHFGFNVSPRRIPSFPDSSHSHTEQKDEFRRGVAYIYIYMCLYVFDVIYIYMWVWTLIKDAFVFRCGSTSTNQLCGGVPLIIHSHLLLSSLCFWALFSPCFKGGKKENPFCFQPPSFTHGLNVQYRTAVAMHRLAFSGDIMWSFLKTCRPWRKRTKPRANANFPIAPVSELGAARGDVVKAGSYRELWSFPQKGWCGAELVV